MTPQTMMANPRVPGSIYARKGRYYWARRLPGETKARVVRLVPAGAMFATTDRAEAEQVARDLYQRALRQVDAALVVASAKSGAEPMLESDHTISDLVVRYTAYARDRYRAPDGEPTGELLKIHYGTLPLLSLYGSACAESFGPLGPWGHNTIFFLGRELRFSRDHGKGMVSPGLTHGTGVPPCLRYSEFLVRYSAVRLSSSAIGRATPAPQRHKPRLYRFLLRPGAVHYSLAVVQRRSS